jgi:hypothetical protein
MRCTVPVPSPSHFATFKIPTPFASCFRTFRSVALSIFGRLKSPSYGGPHMEARRQDKMRCFLQPSSLAMRCTVPVPSPSELANFKIEECLTVGSIETKKSPYRGAHYRGSAARQNEVGLAARAAASCRAPVPAPPSCIAIAMRSMQPLLPL